MCAEDTLTVAKPDRQARSVPDRTGHDPTMRQAAAAGRSTVGERWPDASGHAVRSGGSFRRGGTPVAAGPVFFVRALDRRARRALPPLRTHAPETAMPIKPWGPTTSPGRTAAPPAFLAPRIGALVPDPLAMAGDGTERAHLLAEAAAERADCLAGAEGAGPGRARPERSTPPARRPGG